MKYIIYENSEVHETYDKLKALFCYNLHREDGPAFIEEDCDGNIVKESYFLSDKYCTKEQFDFRIANNLLGPINSWNDAEENMYILKFNSLD